MSSGPPIALGTRGGRNNNKGGGCVQQATILAIADYEAHRPPRRTKAQLAMPRMDREDLLLQCGYGRSDLKRAMAEVQRIKKLRQQSAQGNLWERLSSSRQRRRWWWFLSKNAGTSRRQQPVDLDSLAAAAILKNAG